MFLSYEWNTHNILLLIFPHFSKRLIWSAICNGLTRSTTGLLIKSWIIIYDWRETPEDFKFFSILYGTSLSFWFGLRWLTTEVKTTTWFLCRKLMLDIHRKWSFLLLFFLFFFPWDLWDNCFVYSLVWKKRDWYFNLISAGGCMCPYSLCPFSVDVFCDV